MNAGDILLHNGLIYVVMRAEGRATSARVTIEHETFLSRLDAEILDTSSQFGLIVGQSGAFRAEALPQFLAGLGPEFDGRRPLFARVGRDVIELFVSERSTDEADKLRRRIASAANQTGETVRWGTAHFPRDGATAEELWGGAMNRLFGFEPVGAATVPWIDPVASRLWALRDRWARPLRPLAFIGEEGVGRETLARGIRGSQTPELPFVVHPAARFNALRWAEDVKRAEGGALHLRHPEILPARELSAFFEASAFLPSANFGAAAAIPGAVGTKIYVPPLRDRTADVIPIAEYVLHSVDERMARRRSNLRPDARNYLSRFGARENSRSIRNEVLHAAIGLEGLEVRAESFGVETEHRLDQGLSFRGQLDAAERRVLREALRRLDWNVSLVAKELDVPRRTLVYRMAKLGLRRPGSQS
jgi:hypothetical protein